MKTLFYIVQKCSKYFLALFLFVIFFSHQAKADCFVDGVQFDTTSTDNSNPITLDEIKGWDTSGDDVSTCDVSGLTSLKKAFENNTNFNQDISSWNVSSVQDFSKMFLDADSFNQDISSWNVSAATNMKEMFRNTAAFNQDISGWDVSSVTNMAELFRGAVFNQDISGWDTSSATSFSKMFEFNTVFNQNIRTWNTSNVSTYNNMFNSASAMLTAYKGTTGFGNTPTSSFFNQVFLSSSTPSDNATGVAIDANIVLNFAENVDAETGNITIKKTSDDSTVETIDVTGSKVTGSGSSQITVNPSSTLDISTEFYVLIDATAFDDASSNSFAGISSTTALSFTTNSCPLGSDGQTVDIASGDSCTTRVSNPNTAVSVAGSLIVSSGDGALYWNDGNHTVNITGTVRNSRAGTTHGIHDVTGSTSTTQTVTISGNGTVQGTAAGYYNQGSTVNLTNNQSDLTFKGLVPSSYKILIEGSSDFGKTTFVSPTGTLTFDIASASSISSTGTYSAVLDDISSSNISSTRTGTFGTYDWTLQLASGSSDKWDLIISNTLPTLSSSTPSDNATSVAVDSNIVLNFSESVDAETGNITIKKTSDDSTVETIDVTGSKVTGSGSSQITVNPSTTLDSLTEYYVLIDSTAFDDTDSGSYTGISSATALSFTTADVSSPTLSSSTPANNATDVAVDTNIVLNFSESVDAETGNITIKKKSDDSTFETISVTGSKVTGSGSSTITINPANDFVKGVEYYVLIDATAFDDSSSNSYTGISSTTALGFRIFLADPTSDKDVIGTIDVQSQLAKSSIIQSTSTVSNRLSYLRQNRSNDNLSKNNIKFDFDNAILTSLTNELLAKNNKSIIPDNWSSWSEGSLSSSKIGDSLGSSSSETDAQALAFGFDTKLNNNDLLGFAVQYSKSDTDIGSSGSATDSENINLSVYRTRPLNEDNFIEGMFGVGLIESDLKRISGSNTLTGSRNGKQIFGSINYGKTLDKGDFNLTPVARLNLGYTELDAYSETGTDALSYGKQTIESGLASVGLEFSDIVKFNDNKLKPFGSIEYGMDFSNSSDAKMNYVSDTSTIYTYTQGANSNHLITSVVGFEYITKDNLEIISSYKRIQGNESEQTDILNVSVNFRSKQETEYAMSVDGSEDLKAGFDITKKVNGFDLKFNANQSLSEKSDQRANISLSRSF